MNQLIMTRYSYIAFFMVASICINLQTNDCMTYAQMTNVSPENVSIHFAKDDTTTEIVWADQNQSSSKYEDITGQYSTRDGNVTGVDHTTIVDTENIAADDDNLTDIYIMGLWPLQVCDITYSAIYT